MLFWKQKWFWFHFLNYAADALNSEGCGKKIVFTENKEEVYSIYRDKVSWIENKWKQTQNNDLLTRHYHYFKSHIINKDFETVTICNFMLLYLKQVNLYKATYFFLSCPACQITYITLLTNFLGLCISLFDEMKKSDIGCLVSERVEEFDVWVAINDYYFASQCMLTTS